MSHSRLPSDSSAGTHGPGAKEARAVGRSPASSTAPVDPDAPLVLHEANALEHTAYNFSAKKKWAVLTVVALCQTSMSKSHTIKL
tara:strand:+ start:17351 stop:17605 length:255 start_codon:yes stop_codon:yes gene_type:complete